MTFNGKSDSGTLAAPAVSAARSSNAKGMKIPRVFSDKKQFPFDTVTWETRTAEIKDAEGNVIFQQEGCKVPATWSQMATNVVASKYFYGDAANGNGCPSKGRREFSVEQLIRRVTMTIARWGRRDGYFATDDDVDRFYEELTTLCLHQYGAFNSPVWFNVGMWQQYGVPGSRNGYKYDPETGKADRVERSYEYPQISACFIGSVADDMESIMESAKTEAMLFKAGSGYGADLSTLRSTKEKLTGGGKPSGPVSFFRIFDTVAAAIKSGGRTRRSARMQTLNHWHPDILEFIDCKVKEDRKARALIAAGYSDGMTGNDDEAYRSVMFQNTNITIRLDDEFMRKVTGEDPDPMYWTKAVTTGEPVEQLNAGDVLMRLSRNTWECGDPGVQFSDTISRWHTLPNTAPVHSSNPCCFAGKTLIDTSEGRIRIDELCAMSSRGEQLPMTFSFDLDTALPVLRQIAKVWVAGETDKLAVVKTVRGFEFLCTPDHRFLTQAGKYVPASQLKPGTRLRKIGRMVNARRSGRFQINHRTTDAAPSGTVWQSRFMWEQAYGPIPLGMEVHHKNEDPADDRLSNFEIKSEFDHCSEHACGSRNSRYIDCPDHTLVEAWDAIEADKGRVTAYLWNAHIRKGGHAGSIPLARGDGRIRGMTWAEFAEWIESSKVLTNDRVASVELVTLDHPVPVYDMDVPGTNNFAVVCNSDTEHHSVIAHNSEYLSINESACNLASLNLLKFKTEDGGFDVERYRAAVHIFTIAMDILVENGSYPTPKIAENAYKFRQLGLGYANLGALLMSFGLAYDSEEGRLIAAALTGILSGESYTTSAELAENLGAFDGFKVNLDPMLDVMTQHRNEAWNVANNMRKAVVADGPTAYLFCDLPFSLESAWSQAIAFGVKHGYRNSQSCVIAPTGTIAFLLDCQTTGIEPELGLVKYKKLSGGGQLRIVNQAVPLGLRSLGYTAIEVDAIVAHIDQHDTIYGSPTLKQEHFDVFDCAFASGGSSRAIPWGAHVTMLAAVQPLVSGSISKTIGLPATATPEDIRDAYVMGWKLGLKCMAVYRDGSKGQQPLTTTKDKPAPVVAEAPRPQPRRERLPHTRRSLTHKFDIQGHEGYIIVGFYPDGRPGELFVTMAKEGSTIGGLMDILGTSVSIGLQSGVPLEVFVDKFAHSRFEPAGMTKNPDIPFAKSVADYIFRWMGMEFVAGYREQNAPNRMEEPEIVPSASTAVKPQLGASAVRTAQFQTDAPACDNCGSITVRCGACYRCGNCGNSLGCS